MLYVLWVLALMATLVWSIFMVRWDIMIGTVILFNCDYYYRRMTRPSAPQPAAPAQPAQKSEIA